MRRAFISGFTGSAGTAVVTREKAALWTDGRYFLQVLIIILECISPSHLVKLILRMQSLFSILDVCGFYGINFCEQAEKQLNKDWVLMRSGNIGVPTTGEWLNDVLTPGCRIGIDPVSLLYFLIHIFFLFIIDLKNSQLV